jgi:predicted pyridoxine 5'-phosphate oxidase superfamily flavin-nucleotide-binding protein
MHGAVRIAQTQRKEKLVTAFADIAFTPSVKSAQNLYGSREANRGFELAGDAAEELTERETRFIAARDSFYQATVSESGWPYVQHRGGPAGFLKVLDARTIGYADFRGNVQYLSVGNIASNDRVALILMDYANRRRLKIWGHARIVHADEHPELIARLEMPSYRARVERGIVIEVEAWAWNCPQHITQRFSRAEVERMMAPLIEENRSLKAQIDNARQLSEAR